MVFEDTGGWSPLVVVDWGYWWVIITTDGLMILVCGHHWWWWTEDTGGWSPLVGVDWGYWWVIITCDSLMILVGDHHWWWWTGDTGGWSSLVVESGCLHCLEWRRKSLKLSLNHIVREPGGPTEHPPSSPPGTFHYGPKMYLRVSWTQFHLFPGQPLGCTGVTALCATVPSCVHPGADWAQVTNASFESLVHHCFVT